MTGFSKDFFNYLLCLQNDNVRIADDSLTPTSGTHFIICTPTIKLSCVLYVPQFPINILFVSALIKILNYKIKFFRDHCIIQELRNGRLHNGLYMLEENPGFSSSHALIFFLEKIRMLTKKSYSGIDN